MINEQILKKAIEKAVKSGYGKGYYNLRPRYDNRYIETGNYYGCIFSHDFAKAFWGEKDVNYCPVCDVIAGEPHDRNCDGEVMSAWASWKFHLQQMVLEKEPLKYLERFLVKCPICNDTHKIIKDGIAEDCGCQKK